MFQLPNEKYIYLYPESINIRLSENKLSELCKNKMGIDPREGSIFLFFNKKMDQLKLFFYDEDGYQELLKLLPQGGFLLPTPKEGDKFIKVNRDKLNSIFRTKMF